MARYQLQNPNEKGINSKELYNQCLDQRLVTSLRQMNEHLIEAKDHKVRACCLETCELLRCALLRFALCCLFLDRGGKGGRELEPVLVPAVPHAHPGENSGRLGGVTLD